MQIREILISDTDYPENLRHIASPPKKLFVRGNILPEDQTAIAIVGSRKPTPYGQKAAYDLAAQLAELGVTIISGLAFGIDIEAHKGALDAGGRTIAVLGTGVDDSSIYPHTHKPLADKIMQNGALVSEFEPGTPALPHHFPQRNRIISGLSLGTIVVEAAEKSGSLITANFALEQGREVFAVPGLIYSLLSTGTNKLIQQGAKLISEANDVLAELNLALEQNINPEQKNSSSSSPKEKIILECIEKGITETNDIIASTSFSAGETLSLITMLELKGRIKNIGNGIYAINK